MSGKLSLRVLVADTWDEVDIAVTPEATVTDLKREALKRAGVRRAAEGYVLKYRGAEVWEDGRTLGDAGVVDNAGLIVLPRGRQPVR